MVERRASSARLGALLEGFSLFKMESLVLKVSPGQFLMSCHAIGCRDGTT